MAFERKGSIKDFEKWYHETFIPLMDYLIDEKKMDKYEALNVLLVYFES